MRFTPSHGLQFSQTRYVSVSLPFISLLADVWNGKKRRNHLFFSALKDFIAFPVFLFIRMTVNDLSLSDLVFLSSTYWDQYVVSPEIFVWLENHVEQRLSDMFTKLIFVCSPIHFVWYQILEIHACKSPTIKRWCNERNQIMKEAKVSRNRKR